MKKGISPARQNQGTHGNETSIDNNALRAYKCLHDNEKSFFNMIDECSKCPVYLVRNKQVLNFITTCNNDFICRGV